MEKLQRWRCVSEPKITDGTCIIKCHLKVWDMTIGMDGLWGTLCTLMEMRCKKGKWFIHELWSNMRKQDWDGRENDEQVPKFWWISLRACIEAEAERDAQMAGPSRRKRILEEVRWGDRMGRWRRPSPSNSREGREYRIWAPTPGWRRTSPEGWRVGSISSKELWGAVLILSCKGSMDTFGGGSRESWDKRETPEHQGQCLEILWAKWCAKFN